MLILLLNRSKPIKFKFDHFEYFEYNAVRVTYILKNYRIMSVSAYTGLCLCVFKAPIIVLDFVNHKNK